MALSRATVTAASRIMLPTHFGFSALLGAIWVGQDPERTNIPAFLALRRVWPIPSTGWILLGLAVIVAVGLLSRRRAIAAVALGGGFVAYLALAVAITWSLHPQVDLQWPIITVASPRASLSAPLWPLYVAVAHLASMVSLALDELSDDHGNHTPMRRAAT